MSEPLNSDRAVTVMVYTRYEYRQVHARVHLLGETHLAAGGRVELVLFSQRSKEDRERRVIRGIGREEVSFDTSGIPSGCCDFRATFISREGVRFATRTLLDKWPGDFPWLGSREGITRKVRAPWTPLEVSASPKGLAVGCWGRTHTFAKTAFASQVTSAGRRLLAAPLRPAATVNGEEVRWTRGRIAPVSAGPGQVVFDRRFESPSGLTVTARTEIDFDGMVRVDWSVASKAVVRLDALSLEMALPEVQARYLYHFPGSWGEARNVGALPEGDLRLGFRPYIWLGDEERGISWFAESDAGFHVADPGGVTEILRREDRVVLRVNHVTTPVKLVPGAASGGGFTGFGTEDLEPLTPGGVVTDRLSYTFGFQATPVKEIREDAWDHRILCINQSSTTGRLQVDGALLDKCAASGVRAVVLFEHWSDAEGYTSTPHAAEVRKFVADCKERGLQVLLYFGFLISDIISEWQAVGKDALILPKGGYPVFHYQPQPEQSAWRVCLNSAWQDLLVDGMARIMDEFGIDGVYLDGTEYPFGCCNTEHGCGHVRPDGSIAPTYPIFAVRSAMRRIHEVVKSRRRKGHVNVHNSTCMTMPTLGWATSYWDGEQFQGVGSGVDVAELLPLDAFRAEFMGRQWGVPAEFLHAGAAYTYEQAWAFTLLHDVPVRPHYPDEQLDLAASIWRVMDTFGRKKAEWLPYWSNGNVVRVSPVNAHASLYRHPENGLLAVVSNMDGEQRTVTVKLNLDRLGLTPGAGAADALGGEAIALRDGAMQLTLPTLGWKLLRVGDKLKRGER